MRYSAQGLESLRPAHTMRGIATRANTQKPGARKAVAVSANQILRRSEKSFGSINDRAIGFATRKTTAAITQTTKSSFKLRIIALQAQTEFRVRSAVVTDGRLSVDSDPGSGLVLPE